MHFLFSALVLPYAVTSVLAQNVTVPTTCTPGFEAGSDQVIYNTPYTYDQIMSIIGSYKNLTWSGNPDNTVTLNGTDNTIGTARTYDTAGAHVIETILTYDKPPAPGPYNEVHNTALLSVPTLNISFYIPYDGTVVSSMCNGLATSFNFTAHFCANNATAVGPLLHMLHLNDAITAASFLGGQNFSSCAALTAGNGSNGTASPSTVPYTGEASHYIPSIVGYFVAVVAILSIV